MKTLFKKLFAVSFFVLSGCNNGVTDFGSLSNLDNNQISSSSSKNNTVRSDWFENLSPELQSYYADAKGKTGAELFDSLHNIISKNVSISSYQEAKSYLYATADNIAVNNTNGVFDVYSYAFIPGTGGNGNLYTEGSDENKDGHPKDFINLEHTWPQSFFAKVPPMVADMHHMFPSLSVPNAMRSDNPFGMASEDGRMVIYTTTGPSGVKLGAIDSKHRSIDELKRLINLPYEQRPNLEKEIDEVFEPGDKQKGNTARAMLYFYLRYYNQNIRQGSFNKDEFWVSKVPMFVKWDEVTDPVDDQEKVREEFIFKKQGNRNPFVDIPGLASMISERVLASK